MRLTDSENQKLLALFWDLNNRYFGGILPIIDLKFTGRLRTSGGQYFSKPRRAIRISARYFEFNDPWKEVRDTLGHEMVHYWLDFLGKPCGHTPEFRRKLIECGFSRYSRLLPLGTKYIYTCPSCDLEYFRKRKGVWSCGRCSGGRFNRSYQLVLSEKKPPQPNLSRVKETVPAGV